jgi:hypothetical protein
MKVRKKRTTKPKDELKTIRLMVNISKKALDENWNGSKKEARKAADVFINLPKFE